MDASLCDARKKTKRRPPEGVQCGSTETVFSSAYDRVEKWFWQSTRRPPEEIGGAKQKSGDYASAGELACAWPVAVHPDGVTTALRNGVHA